VEVVLSDERQKMKKLLVILGFILFSIFVFQFILKSEKKVVSPSAAYILREDEIKTYQSAARSGSCEAANRLARFHLNISFRTDEAIYWYRLGHQCVDVNAKLELIGLLMDSGDRDVMAEVDQLLIGIEKIDPREATRAKEAIRANRERRLNQTGKLSPSDVHSR
jgi:hypothetical protein